MLSLAALAGQTMRYEAIIIFYINTTFGGNKTDPLAFSDNEDFSMLIKTHDSQSRGQNARSRQMSVSELFTCTTTQKFAGAVDKSYHLVITFLLYRINKPTME